RLPYTTVFRSVELRSRMLAKPDEHHLVEPALDVAREARVRLHAIDDEHVIGSMGMLIEVNRKTVRRAADDHRLHRRADLAAHALGRDSVASEECELTFGRRSAVAAHRRHEKRNGPDPLQMINSRLEDR